MPIPVHFVGFMGDIAHNFSFGIRNSSSALFKLDSTMHNDTTDSKDVAVKLHARSLQSDVQSHCWDVNFYDKECAKYFSDLGDKEFRSSGDKVEQYLRKATELDPGDSSYNYQLAVFYKNNKKRGNHDNAYQCIISLERAIMIDPSKASYHATIADCYRDFGYVKESVNSAQKAVELTQNNKDKEYYQSRLDHLQKHYDLLLKKSNHSPIGLPYPLEWVSEGDAALISVAAIILVSLPFCCRKSPEQKYIEFKQKEANSFGTKLKIEKEVNISKWVGVWRFYLEQDLRLGEDSHISSEDCFAGLQRSLANISQDDLNLINDYVRNRNAEFREDLFDKRSDVRSDDKKNFGSLNGVINLCRQMESSFGGDGRAEAIDRVANYGGASRVETSEVRIPQDIKRFLSKDTINFLQKDDHRLAMMRLIDDLRKEGTKVANGNNVQNASIVGLGKQEQKKIR
jgi:hypothetical protein